MYGLNLVGLKSRGFSDEALASMKKAYKIMFRSGLGLVEALVKTAAEFPDSKEVAHLVDFIRKSKRGITR